MPFEIQKIRSEFPILNRPLADGQRLVYLDNGATSQKPQCVIDCVSQFWGEQNANIHRGLHRLSAEATTRYETARETISQQLGLSASQVLIFTRGATESINLVTHGLRSSLQAGDEIVITLMEHHANFVPWQILAETTGAKLRFIPVLEDGALDLDAWKSAFTARTKVAAFTHTSNVLGTVNPVREMTGFARERDVLTLVDGAQVLPHGPVNLDELGADFFVFSGHKVFAPDGIGVLVGSRQILDEFPVFQSGGDMIDKVAVEGTTFREAPERFEAGTPNISGALGLAEAFRYIDTIDWNAAREHEARLLQMATGGLEDLGGTRIYGTTSGKASILSFTMEEAHPQDIASILDNLGIAIRTGHHCAQPLMTHFGITGTARASFAFYNDEDDVTAFLNGMKKVKDLFAF